MTVQPPRQPSIVDGPPHTSLALTAGTLAFSHREILLTVATLCMASASWLTGTTTPRDHVRRRVATFRPLSGTTAVSMRCSLEQRAADAGAVGTGRTSTGLTAGGHMTGGWRPNVSGSTLRRAAFSAAAGLGPAVILPVPVGVTVGIIVGMIAARLLASIPDRDAQRRQARLVEDLPLALDLIAACLTAGAPIVAALDIVASAVGGPLGAELGMVSRSLRLGASMAEACGRLLGPEPSSSRPAAKRWTRLVPAGPAPGGFGRPTATAEAHEIAAFARALHRSEESGARLAAALGRLADQTRARRQERALTAARRAGVTAVAPLGLCFLPAFVALGVVPVVMGAGSALTLP
ncbi:type II secretion system F family protein [Protofrankia coriariae]|uniref:type II secretion system F family protein n=1 Tax=Protofrankia coriariae TaxID=1562887 RepID=UPI00069A063B|nr:type II secretion system F family protein [Protofrankia coriariae]